MATKKKDKPVYHLDGIDLLIGSKKPKNGVVGENINLGEIVLPAKQPRRYFDGDELEKLTLSVRKNGILQPVLVRPCEEGYELIAGERRYRAAKKVGLSQIPAIVQNLSDLEAKEIALLENLHREDLNPIDETEGVLDLLALKLETDEKSVISLLGIAAHKKRKSAEEVFNSPQWETITEVLADVGYTPDSFRSNRLPLLKMPDDVLQAVREGRLAYTKAKLISKVSNKRKRIKLHEEVIAQKLSIVQLRSRVAELNDSQSKTNRKQKKVIERLDKVCKKAKKSQSWHEPEKQERLIGLLEELEEILAE